MKYLLLISIMTNENFNRGWGDGIAASKSASATVHTERFKSFSQCENIKSEFLKSENINELVRNKKGEITGRKIRNGVSAKCIKL